MERPSHILFDRHSSLSRAPVVGLAIGLQFVGFWLFTQGLREHHIDFGPGVIHVDPIEQRTIPSTTPPPLPPLFALGTFRPILAPPWSLCAMKRKPRGEPSPPSRCAI